jgi:hypothetical protein
MPTTPTEPLRRETDGFTFVVLGLLSTLRRIDEQASRPASGRHEPLAAGRPGVDETIHAGLGIHSLRRTLERWLEVAARTTPEEPPRTPRAAPREILR